MAEEEPPTPPAKSFCHAKTTIFLLLLIVVLILLIYIGVYLESPCDKQSSEDGIQIKDCDDISIIGAGIAGTYTAWRLKNSGVKVGIYEYLDRVGGRLYTQYFPGIPDIAIELGGARFPEYHTLMNKTALELGLPVVDFNHSWDNKDALYYLRGHHFSYNELQGAYLPYNLDKSERHTPEKLHWKIFAENANISNELTKKEDLFKLTTPDGRFFYDQSFQEIFTKYSTMEAWRYYRDVSAWRSCDKDVSALVFFPTKRPDSKEQPTIYSTIQSGMDSYPKVLLEKFLEKSSRHKLYQNHKLETIKKHPSGSHVLGFRISGMQKNESDKVKQVCSNNVVMAIPTTSLLQVKWSVFNSAGVRQHLDSVVTGPAVKLYLAYDKPWWRKFPKFRDLIISDLPTMRTTEYGVSKETGKAVLMVAYVDAEDVKYWKHLQSTGSRFGSFKGSNSVSDRVVKQANIFLSQLLNVSISSVPMPIDGIMAFWDSYPFGGGWEMWKPGHFVPDVVKYLVKPSETDNVYIASGSYTLNDGSDWAENALKAAEDVLGILQTRFNLEKD